MLLVPGKGDCHKRVNHTMTAEMLERALGESEGGGGVFAVPRALPGTSKGRKAECMLPFGH